VIASLVTRSRCDEQIVNSLIFYTVCLPLLLHPHVFSHCFDPFVLFAVCVVLCTFCKAMSSQILDYKAKGQSKCNLSGWGMLGDEGRVRGQDLATRKGKEMAPYDNTFSQHGPCM
jgi:hypothetical protein